MTRFGDQKVETDGEQHVFEGRQLTGHVRGFIYRASVPAKRPAKDYTACVIASRFGVAFPLEADGILWQR